MSATARRALPAPSGTPRPAVDFRIGHRIGGRVRITIPAPGARPGLRRAPGRPPRGDRPRSAGQGQSRGPHARPGLRPEAAPGGGDPGAGGRRDPGRRRSGPGAPPVRGGAGGRGPDQLREATGAAGRGDGAGRGHPGRPGGPAPRRRRGLARGRRPLLQAGLGRDPGRAQAERGLPGSRWPSRCSPPPGSSSPRP